MKIRPSISESRDSTLASSALDASVEEDRFEMSPHDAILLLGSDKIGPRMVVHGARCLCEQGVAVTIDAHMIGSLMTHPAARAEVILIAKKYGLVGLPEPEAAA